MQKLQVITTSERGTVKSGKMVYTDFVFQYVLEYINERHFDEDATVLLYNDDGTITTLAHSKEGEYI